MLISVVFILTHADADVLHQWSGDSSYLESDPTNFDLDIDGFKVQYSFLRQEICLTPADNKLNVDLYF